MRACGAWGLGHSGFRVSGFSALTTFIIGCRVYKGYPQFLQVWGLLGAKDFGFQVFWARVGMRWGWARASVLFSKLI